MLSAVSAARLAASASLRGGLHVPPQPSRDANWLGNHAGNGGYSNPTMQTAMTQPGGRSWRSSAGSGYLLEQPSTAGLATDSEALGRGGSHTNLLRGWNATNAEGLQQASTGCCCLLL